MGVDRNYKKFKKTLDFLSRIKYNNGVTESEVMILSPRTGRPKVTSPKYIRFSIRIDEETNCKLEAYCESKKITKGEAVRRGVCMLLDKKNETG